ncbi:MAG: MBOAT family protein, partial [Saprospiraceae bacterium]|nr:MBOAT family protein [Saprospiraceae bacterium]
MLFNSFEYALFLPIVFVLYWFIFNRNLRSSNLFLLAVSYLFYGWWDYRFLSLIILSSLVDFHVGKKLGTTHDIKTKKHLCLLSIIVNLGLLGFFKYYNFFITEFVDAFGLSTLEGFSSLNVILPVGISFYTFQTLSYSIDIYRNKIEPEKDWVTFFAFVSFFPQLVAGPIERAANLVPQFRKIRVFKYHNAKDGMRQILWGLFKKIVIADSAGLLANDTFGNTELFGTAGLI